MTSIPLNKRVVDMTVEELISVIHESSIENAIISSPILSTRKVNLKKLLEIYPWAQQTVYGWVSDKYIPHSKVGRHLMFDLDEIEKWIESFNIKIQTRI
jgi:excisionase family DNA binding protein